MENASKALIIAGAILLAILIISLGLIVYNQAKETVGSVNLTQQEIEAFNSKFTSYEGTNVAGSQVNALIQTVISSNQQAINDNTSIYVKILFPSITDNKYIVIQGGVAGGPASLPVNSMSYASVSKTKYDEYIDGDPQDFNGVSFYPKKDPEGSLKVNTGKTYTVKLMYKGGRVSSVLVG